MKISKPVSLPGRIPLGSGVLLFVLIAMLVVFSWIEFFDSIKYRIEIFPAEIIVQSGELHSVTAVPISIKNRTGRGIAIKKLLLSCGCMNAHTTSPEIPRNESTSIQFEIAHQKFQVFTGTMQVIFMNTDTKEEFVKVVPVRVARSSD